MKKKYIVAIAALLVLAVAATGGFVLFSDNKSFHTGHALISHTGSFVFIDKVAFHLGKSTYQQCQMHVWITDVCFPRGSDSQESTAMQETWVPSLGCEDPLEKGMATHSIILAWRIPWTEEPGVFQSMESPRVRHD